MHLSSGYWTAKRDRHAAVYSARSTKHSLALYTARWLWKRQLIHITMYRLQTNYNTPRTTWPESSARAGVAPTPARCFARYTDFRWGSGSSVKWLFWLTRWGPQPLQRISASWYRPVHHLGLCILPMLRCWSFLAYTPNWPVALFLLLLHPLELSTCWHSTVRKHSHFQTPLENPSVQTQSASVYSDIKALYKSVIIITII